MTPAATAAARASRAAPARAIPGRAPSRTRPAAPARPRRASAPRSRPAARARVAPAPSRGVRLVPLAIGHTAAAVSNLADTGVLFRLTRGRLWIATLTTLLVGIVALNVMELSFGAAASNLGRQADVLKREDSTLRTRLAGTLSGARVQQVAGAHGLVQVDPGSIRYLNLSGDDAAIAARRLVQGDLTYGSPALPVSADSSLIPPPPLATTTTTATTTTIAPTTTAATATPTTTAIPAATTTPVATATPTTNTPATTASAGGVGAP